MSSSPGPNCQRGNRSREARSSGRTATPPNITGSVAKKLDLASRLLFPLWQFGPGEEDITAMREVVEGTSAGRRVRRTFEMLDRYDRVTKTSSMARTTGYTCAAGVRLVARGLWGRKGVSPLEFLGRERACYEFVMAALAARGVAFREAVEPLA